MIDRGKFELIAQLIETLSDAYQKLEQANENENVEELNKAKKEMLNLQKQISELI